MTAKPLLVTGANAGFFPLLRDLLDSIEACGAAGDVELGFFDYGLTAEQRDWLGGFSDRIVEPEEPRWIKKLAWKAKGLGVTVARAEIPDYFPGFDTYLWVDADVWLQDRRGVGLFDTFAAQRPSSAASDRRVSVVDALSHCSI